MKLSRTVAYAIHATLQLACSDSGGVVSCSRLAAEGHMPERFLLQILRNLVNHGILDSTRGVDGGYRLERRPADISLLDLIEAVDGPWGASLPIHEGLPEGSRTKLECAFQRITELAREELRAITLVHLLPMLDGKDRRRTSRG